MFDPNEKAPTPPVNPSAEEMLAVCQQCGGACCRYVATEIDEPKNVEDFENIRWYCTHKDTWVFMEDGIWHLAFNGACEHLREDSSCGIYEDRPQVCRDHKFGECDYYLRGKFDLELRSMAEVDAYLHKRFPAHFRRKRLAAKAKEKRQVSASSDK